MTNEISLRTNKSEYNSGEHIYGVVYLRINTPTRGRGVRIRFKGYEKFEYVDKTTFVNEHPVCYRDHRDYIIINEALLESDGPLSMCITYFPFKILLPIEIPGTFHAHDETDEKKWDAKVEYLLEAEVIGASRSLAVLTVVTILQPLPESCRYLGQPVACHTFHPARYLIFFKRNVHITARLHDHIHRTGENAKLRVIMTNNSSVIVQSIKIQLLRSITLLYRGEDKVTVDVEVKEKVGREQTVDMVRFPKGLDNIQIPLKDTNNRPVYPSVRGQHMKCEYEVLVTVFLSNGDTFDLNVPISVIVAEKNKQWGSWIQPGWVTNDAPNIQLIEDSVLRVPENILSSEAFSSLPGFQPL
ncbi:uncharacterized protein LOC123563053 isoform X1 [Mercenaria mercenaria]|uniref:uncharacterized protein LOC123563053 isoform X1 n=1 Tax=Mercenaria mercenaria TaxID=6596 RepID=UPI00234F752D|nr:uncharacterized protein LOC123563053 isoform X1 [Mercenaria mercenaria]